MYLSLAQCWGERVAIENECKEVGRWTYFGNGLNDALPASVPYKPGMNDRGADFGPFVA
jgi:hypothetical protein